MLAAALAALGCAAHSTKTATEKEAPQMTSLSGKSIRWTFTDGPTAGTPFEHSFGADGSVTWRIVDGPHKGTTKREGPYAAEQIGEQTWAVSYLAASGHTLTVVLSFADHRAIGFASNDKTWVPLHGTFEVVR
jgi:molybdenum cofactor biosynthesis protein MoaF